MTAQDSINGDHVFGAAFGGRKKVDTHQSCNSRESETVERQLHKPESLFSLVRHVLDLGCDFLPGMSQDGKDVAVSLTKGTAHPVRPEVAVVDTGVSLHISATGTEKQVKKIVKDCRAKFGSGVPLYDELGPQERKKVGGATHVEISLTIDLVAAEGFAVKTALNAGVVAFGPDFATSPLAQELRGWRDGKFDNPFAADTSAPRAPLAELDALDDAMEKFADEMEAGGLDRPELPKLVPTAGKVVNDAIFIPKGATTRVFVHVAGTDLLPYGLILDAPLPEGPEPITRELPVLVREDDKPIYVVEFARNLITPVAQHAEEVLGSSPGPPLSSGGPASSE